MNLGFFQVGEKEKVNGIITIGFEKDGYLAYSLEVFLIRESNPTPRLNKIGKK
jgi:hypothetical protein